MDWTNILALRAWTPLSEVLQNPVAPIIEDLFQVGENAYLRAQMLNRNLETGDPQAPFVTKAYWGDSLNAVKREVLGDPLMGAEVTGSRPPAELLLGTSGTYGELVEQARAAAGNFSERAVYSSGGQFLYKAITSGRMQYCFLDRVEVSSERVFLIQVSLLKS